MSAIDNKDMTGDPFPFGYLARYTGTGSTTEAENFNCATLARRK